MAKKVKDEIAASHRPMAGSRDDIAGTPDAKATAIAPSPAPAAPPQQLENSMVQQILERQAVFGF